MKKSILPILFILSCFTARAMRPDSLRREFRHPRHVQTSCYWYWISGNVSKEGVVEDLRSMKTVGINRAFLGFHGLDTSEALPGPVHFMSDTWWDILHTALKTATEEGIEIGIFNGPGWSQAGGPWIGPEQSMRYLDCTKEQVHGGGKRSVQFLRPGNYLSDFRVLAYPSREAERVGPQDILSCEGMDHPVSIFDGDTASVARMVSQGRASVVFKRHFTPRRIVIRSSTSILGKISLEVLDGDIFRDVVSFHADRTNHMIEVGYDTLAPVAVSVPDTEGDCWRLVFDVNPDCGLREVEISDVPVVDMFPDKKLSKLYQAPLPFWNEYKWPCPDRTGQAAVAPEEVIDLTKYLKGDHLTWRFPEGEWTVVRTYLAPTLICNGPTLPGEGRGLEVDRWDAAALGHHYDSFLGEIQRRIPEEDRRCWKMVVCDSYERATQNIGDDFIVYFKERMGYDPTPYLLTYDGTVVGSQEESDRFLWDLRRVIADRLAYDHIGGLRKLAHRDGKNLWLETYGHWGFPGEFLQYGGQADEVAGEFWSEGTLGDIENRAASSCAHIYGKRLVSSESFTCGPPEFSRSPRDLKLRGDRFFTEGVNNTLLHLYISQPEGEGLPGFNCPFGNEFNRYNTWYRHLDIFTDYLKRCNLLLQQGKYVADVAYFIGEDTPVMTGITQPPLPKGYQFDYINAEALLTRLKADDYKLLVLPPSETLSPGVLEKLISLSQEGLAILGPKPMRAPGLSGYPQSDARVRELADTLWKRDHVFSAGSVEEVLKYLGVDPDFCPDVPFDIKFCHTTDGLMDFYYMANQEDREVTFIPQFRTRGRAALWYPATGDICAAPEGSLTLAPHESVFAVFGDPSTEEALPSSYDTYALSGPWQVELEDMLGESRALEMDVPEDLTHSEDRYVRFFSGTATYRTSFVWEEAGRRAWLDLGTVREMARVKVNGKDVGGLFTPPYRLEITRALSPGENALEVEVTTNWHNRLVGDAALEEGRRATHYTYRTLSAEEPLQPSGLIGMPRLLVESDSFPLMEGDVAALRDYIVRALPASTRYTPEDEGRVMALPRPYSVPYIKGAFQEMYYWDSYFTNVGLLRAGYAGQAKNNADNILSLIDSLGYMPNGSHRDLLGRSQPPVAALMVKDIYLATGDRQWLIRARETLLKEYGFWMKERMLPIGLNRYGHNASSAECIAFCGAVSGRLGRASVEKPEEQGAHDLAEAESGWDFTPRFDGRCMDYAPVDLNALLYMYEKFFAWSCRELDLPGERGWRTKAARRSRLMRKYCLDPADGLFYDYDGRMGRRSGVLSAAAYLPLFAGMATQAEARALRNSPLEEKYGLSACAGEGSGVQWDAPNAWAACHYFAVGGLCRYGFLDDARRIARKYLFSNLSLYRETGRLWEKYNARTGRLDVSEEYATPGDFMGWTAGTLLSFIEDLYGSKGAVWIGADGTDDILTGKTRIRARYFRKEFPLEARMTGARLDICGLGLYEARVNGVKVGGKQALSPTPSDYSKTVYYNSFDVTELLREGENRLDVVVGGGRFSAMRTAQEGKDYMPTAHYGLPQLLCRLTVRYADGRMQTIVSGPDWKATTGGPIRWSNEFDGETYDASKSLDKAIWRDAIVVEAPGGHLRHQPNPNIEVQDTLRPVSVRERDGRFLFDMGQNMVGVEKISGKAGPGDTLVLRFAETLDADGNLYTANLRTADVTDTLIVGDGGHYVWQPAFTYHGFRYAEVRGAREMPEIEGLVLYDRMRTTGHFECSDPVINQVYWNAWWGIRGNYRGMPTDCPQRDERMGWLGDRTTGCRGEAYLLDNHALYAKWLQDIADSQFESGSLPNVAPRYWDIISDNVTWPAVFITAADMLYRQYGDAEPLEKHYPAMKKWLYYIYETYGKDGIITQDTFGDWCMPPESLELIHSQDPSRVTPGPVLSTASFCYLCLLMEGLAPVAGYPEDAPGYREMAGCCTEAFNRAFFDAGSANYANGTVTANILPLCFGMVPEGYRDQVFDNIVQKTEKEFSSHVSVGVVGIQWLMRCLSEHGRGDLALHLATDTTYPGWGYMASRGATTIWELWNGDTAAPEMNSGNHVMILGDLLLWYYQYLGGIRPLEPGFRKIELRPLVPAGLDGVNCSYDSVSGRIESCWEQSPNGFRWTFTIPEGTSAEVYIPGSEEGIPYESGVYTIECP